MKGSYLKAYPTIPWSDTVSSMKTLRACKTTEDVLRMFREVKLQAPKKGTASTADSLATSERTKRVTKPVAETEAQSRPPRKIAVNPKATKRLLPKKKELLPAISDVSSSDSFSRSSGRPDALASTPMTEDEFNEEDVARVK